MSDDAVSWLRQQVEGDHARWSTWSGRLNRLAWPPMEEISFRIADCESKLAIISACVPSEATERAVEDGTISAEEYVAMETAGRVILRHLASAYRHRPGYADHWPSS